MGNTKTRSTFTDRAAGVSWHLIRPDVLTFRVVASGVNVSEDKLRRMVKAGEFPAPDLKDERPHAYTVSKLVACLEQTDWHAAAMVAAHKAASDTYRDKMFQFWKPEFREDERGRWYSRPISRDGL